jgi:hypothetical protein
MWYYNTYNKGWTIFLGCYAPLILGGITWKRVCRQEQTLGALEWTQGGYFNYLKSRGQANFLIPPLLDPKSRKKEVLIPRVRISQYIYLALNPYAMSLAKSVFTNFVWIWEH